MLSFSNAVGNLFNRLGRLGKCIAAVRTHQLAQIVNMIDTTNGVVAQFNAESDIQALMGSAYIGILSSVESVGGLSQNIASQTISRMVFRDNPRLGQTLQSITTLSSINEVIRQMTQQGATILAQTVTATPLPFANPSEGNGTVVASVKRPFDGRTLENAFAENLLVTCSADSFTGGATQGQEQLLVTGVGQQTDVFSFDWPLGSNATAGLTCIDGSQNASGNNLLTNSDFETWVAGAPSNYEIVVGSSTISQETGIVFSGASALKLTGDGSTLTEWRQLFGNTTGTAGTLSASTQYAFNVWVRRDGTSAAVGQLAVELIDDANNIIQDNAGNDNSFTIDLTTLTTVYTPKSGTFRTPERLPSTIYIRYRLTTGNALTNGRAVYFDKSALGVTTKIYVGGPSLAIFSGSLPFVVNDFTTVGVTNSRGAAGTLSTFQTLLFQLFPDVQSNEILFPSSSVPTISDLLITA